MRCTKGHGTNEPTRRHVKKEDWDQSTLHSFVPMALVECILLIANHYTYMYVPTYLAGGLNLNFFFYFKDISTFIIEYVLKGR